MLHFRFILAAGALALGGVSHAAPVDRVVSLTGSGQRIPRPSVVILWGTWCAPCAAELRRIPALAKAAAPLPVVTLAINSPAKAIAGIAKSGLPIATAFADDRPPGTVLAEWGGKEAILPLAVAIDRHGAVCGTRRGLLGTDQMREWNKTCWR